MRPPIIRTLSSISLVSHLLRNCVLDRLFHAVKGHAKNHKNIPRSSLNMQHLSLSALGKSFSNGAPLREIISQTNKVRFLSLNDLVLSVVDQQMLFRLPTLKSLSLTMVLLTNISPQAAPRPVLSSALTRMSTKQTPVPMLQN